MTVEFQWNRAAFRELAVSDEIRAVVVGKAEEAKAIAEALSADFVVSGDYISSFNVRSATTTFQGGEHPVAAGILENTSDHAMAVEWGNANDHDPHRVMGRTMEAMGRVD